MAVACGGLVPWWSSRASSTSAWSTSCASTPVTTGTSVCRTSRSPLWTTVDGIPVIDDFPAGNADRVMRELLS